MKSMDLMSQKILWLEKKIRMLKTSHYKTATTISTITDTAMLNFSLYLDSAYSVQSTKRAIVTLTSTDGSDMISACYLNGVTPNNLNDRYVFVNRLSAPEGVAKFEVIVMSQNYNDFETLLNGGSVNLSYGIQVIGSSKFTTSIVYRDFMGGSS